jgi:DNA-binding IclR family transcriptional regulator
LPAVPPTEDQQPIRGTASFSKFVRVLQFVADAPDRVSVTDIAQATGIPRPSAHRIVSALLQEGMLAEQAGMRGLALGSRLISLAYRSWDELELRRVARPHIEKLNQHLDETVHLAINAGSEMVYVDKLESRRAVRMTSRLGTRVSLHASAVGKAWLAAQPVDRQHQLTAGLALSSFTPHTITDHQKLDAEIALTRERSYALDLQESELDICCYGKAIVGSGQVLGCVSLSLPRYRFDELAPETAITAIENCVSGIAQDMSRQLGL